ncbi:hypothetical protein [Streptomyces sp. NPDC002187]|uniref:hypothetical protein n=1 Tax=Streptomyces sp. NPDC002187 TaxID=3364637 RepID=UPI00369C3F78
MALAEFLAPCVIEAEIHALDRALVVISVDPDLGEPIPGDTAGPQMRQYADEARRQCVLRQG